MTVKTVFCGAVLVVAGMVAFHAPAFGAAGRVAGAAAAVRVFASAQPARLDAPNVVIISSRLVTAGQPTRSALASLGSQGFAADIYLAPPSVADAVHDEAAIVERQGMAYLDIPINFQRPTAADFTAFSSAMKKFEGRKVLVHCQLNMRASSMVFLYRVIVGGEDPEQAYTAVTRVWVPDRQWRAFMVRRLRKHHIAFEPY
ncbi:MAG: hypothetical protein EPN74_07025 [Rhodanobacter sp.]|nr:MAG: hypothetical protein EPN74_07025 [Rhodanobacter sp.]